MVFSLDQSNRQPGRSSIMSQKKTEVAERHFSSLLLAISVLRGVADAIDHGRGKVPVAASDPMPALVVDAYVGLAVRELSSLVSDRAASAKLLEIAKSLAAAGLRET